MRIDQMMPAFARIRPPRVSRRTDPLWQKQPLSDVIRPMTRLAMSFGRPTMVAYLRGRLLSGLRACPEFALPPDPTNDFAQLAAILRNPGWWDPRFTLRDPTAIEPTRAFDVEAPLGAGDPNWCYLGAWDAPAPRVVLPNERDGGEAGAEGRARDLLREHLSPEQRLDYLANQRFTVIGSDGRRFVVHDGNGGRKVEELDGKGRVCERWCLIGDDKADVEPGAPIVQPWPAGDVLLHQKLLLETDADEFRRRAARLLPSRRNVRAFLQLVVYLFDNRTSDAVWSAILRVTNTERAPVLRATA